MKRNRRSFLKRGAALIGATVLGKVSVEGSPEEAGVGDEVELQGLLDNARVSGTTHSGEPYVQLPAKRWVLNKPVVLRRSVHVHFNDSPVLPGPALQGADWGLIQLERGSIANYFSYEVNAPIVSRFWAP